jgi:hypothetical protein
LELILLTGLSLIVLVGLTALADIFRREFRGRKARKNGKGPR